MIERLNHETAMLLTLPGMKSRLDMLAMEAAPDTSSHYFLEQIESKTARWRPVIQAAGITLG